MGPRFHVENLTPPGAEPHDLELSPREVGRIVNASVVLYLSHGFQPAVNKAVEQARGRKVDVLAGLPLRGDDPHVWLDPLLFARIGTKIGVALHRPSSGFVADMRKLDQAYRNGLRDCKRREIVTSHAAFGYLAARYGLEQVAITGLAPESEPSPQQLAHVVEVVRQTHATTVFFETLVSPRLAETVAREVGARTAVLDPIEGLTPDEQKRGDDYLTLMRAQSRCIAEGARVSLALRLQGVTFAYGHTPPVLRNVDLDVQRGEFVAIAGPNGGGKTTLVRLIVGLEHPTSGRVELDVDNVGYLPQRAQAGIDAPLTVRELVTAGRASRTRLIGPLGGADREAVRAAVERVGLAPQVDRRLSTLSGGQQQRAFIAKALAGEPELLVLDEPTTGVDVEAQEAIAALLQRLRSELAMTILYVSHEFGAVEEFVKRIVLVRGEIVFDGPPSALPGVWHDPSHTHA